MKVTVLIDIPNVTKKEVLNNPDWVKDGKIIIDEAYLTRNDEDDSFFDFDIISISN